MRELLLGAGQSRDKRIWLKEASQFQNLVTLDINPDAKPNVLFDLEIPRLPFKDDSFDEIHAYEVLEHVGMQGDWRFFFKQFDDFARVLVDQGVMFITSPPYDSSWLWGDPGHTRFMGLEVYTFLSRKQYDIQLGKTPMTDYRRCFVSDWDFIGSEDGSVVLRNRK
jgi:hypothetical protein